MWRRQGLKRCVFLFPPPPPNTQDPLSPSAPSFHFARGDDTTQSQFQFCY